MGVVAMNYNLLKVSLQPVMTMIILWWSWSSWSFTNLNRPTLSPCQAIIIITDRGNPSMSITVTDISPFVMSWWEYAGEPWLSWWWWLPLSCESSWSWSKASHQWRLLTLNIMNHDRIHHDDVQEEVLVKAAQVRKKMEDTCRWETIYNHIIHNLKFSFIFKSKLHKKYQPLL